MILPKGKSQVLLKLSNAATEESKREKAAKIERTVKEDKVVFKDVEKRKAQDRCAKGRAVLQDRAKSRKARTETKF